MPLEQILLLPAKQVESNIILLNDVKSLLHRLFLDVFGCGCFSLFNRISMVLFIFVIAQVLVC